jgi:hypothetical protein
MPATVTEQWVATPNVGQPALATLGVYSALQELGRGHQTCVARTFFQHNDMLLDAREYGITGAKGQVYVRRSDIVKMLAELKLPFSFSQLTDVMSDPQVWGFE